jgi:hypothetical protein
MSVAIFSSANGVASTISSAMTMNVYGRRSASWTMDTPATSEAVTADDMQKARRVPGANPAGQE